MKISIIDFWGEQKDEFAARQMNVLTLAYIGDTIHDLYIRSKMVSMGDQKVQEIHKKTVSFVKANAQAEAIEQIMDELNEQEKAVFLRGRNSKSLPTKNTDMANYKKATGFEAILGYLYMSGQDARLLYLLDKAYVKTREIDKNGKNTAAR